MTVSKGILRPRKYWSAADLKRLASLYPNHGSSQIAKLLNRTIPAIYLAAKKLGLKKSDQFLRAKCRLQKGSSIGEQFRFKKGMTPANKGLRRPGWHAGRMKETQFKKGQISGFAAKNLRPIGTILADHEGYLRIKVRHRIDGDAPGRNKDIWPLVHHQVWEQHKGPVPAKHIVVFKDRNRANCAIENLELISMAENAHRNRMWGRMPRELAEAIQLNGVLKRKIRSINGQK